MKKSSDPRWRLQLTTRPGFAAFYSRNVDAVFDFAVRRCATASDVADLVSATFLEALNHASRFDPSRGTERAWLIGIADHCFHDQLRDRYRRLDLIQRLGSAAELTDDEFETVERQIDAVRQRSTLEEAMSLLSGAEAKLFALVADDGYSVAEASRILNISPAAGRMRLARARRTLRTALQANPLEDS